MDWISEIDFTSCSALSEIITIFRKHENAIPQLARIVELSTFFVRFGFNKESAPFATNEIMSIINNPPTDFITYHCREGFEILREVIGFKARKRKGKKTVSPKLSS